MGLTKESWLSYKGMRWFPSQRHSSIYEKKKREFGEWSEIFTVGALVLE